MRYRNFELIKNTECELLCSVTLRSQCSEEELEQIEDTIEDLFPNTDVYVEEIADDYINVRCDDITFNKTGVKLLKRIYDKLTKELTGATVKVCIHIDEWFKDGDEDYNEDEVTWEDFIKQLEY